MAGLGMAGLILLGVMIWVASMSMDTDRITGYIQDRGGRIVSINWAPFGKGWFGEKNDRIYEVVYYDSEGNQHWATCKTSLFSGVYWTDDRVAYRKANWYDGLPARNEPGDPVIRHVSQSAGDPIPAESLDDEIARLKQRLRELEERKQKEGAV
jgi:hypothetical protein